MTREEAINELIEMYDYINGNIEIRSKQYKALNIAIEALKQKDEIGEWHFNSDPRCGDFVCSECLERSIVCSEYCPNCGVKIEV